MRRAGRALLLGCAALQALPVLANELTLAPSPAACLSSVTGERGTPEYPQEQWTSGTPGRVQVELTFTGPALRPEVTVLSGEGGPEFVESVQRHVRDLRLPCLEAADVPARLRIDFNFNPIQRKPLPPEAIDPYWAEQRRLLGCVVAPTMPPTYPTEARERSLQGRVLVEMRFTSSDGPPEITIVSRPNSKPLLRFITPWAEKFRMPCYAGSPVRASRMLVFRISGEERYGFREISLAQFVGGVRNIERQRLQLDFNTMGCPFEVRLQYLQPLRPNQAFWIGALHPGREPFLDWLESVELKLDESGQDTVFGDSLVILVPCMKIDLVPKPRPG